MYSVSIRNFTITVAMLMLCLSSNTSKSVIVDDNEAPGATTCNDAYTTNPLPLGPDQLWFTHSGYGTQTGQASKGLTYLRNGYVLGAWHVKGQTQTFVLNGVTYYRNPVAYAALAEFGDDEFLLKLLEPYPDLPPLYMATVPPAVNDFVHIMSYGRPRGAALVPASNGWAVNTGLPFRMSWGMSNITTTQGPFSTPTPLSFQLETVFDDLNDPDTNTTLDIYGNWPCEGTAAGDSGGGIFVGEGDDVRIIGTFLGGGGGIFGSSTNYGSWDYRDTATVYDPIIDTPNCNNTFDDDGDGFADYPDDPGCSSANDATELEINGFESLWGVGSMRETLWGVGQ